MPCTTIAHQVHVRGLAAFGPDAQAIFVRDPDRNVIELHQRG